MNNAEEVRKIEAIIDKDFEDLNFWSLSIDTAIIVSCQLFERWVLQMEDEIKSAINVKETLKLENAALDLMQGLEWLIKMSRRKCSKDGFTFESNVPIIEFAQEAFLKSLIHSKAEQIFIPYGQNLYSAKININEENEKELEFNFPSKDFADLEGINSILLDEHNHYKLNKYNKVDKTISKMYHGIPEMIYHTRSFAKVEFDFDFPDEYKIGPYSVKDIKNTWRRVIREAWWADRRNRELENKKTEEFPTLMDLKMETWNYDDINKEMAYKLIDDLSYTGKRKGKQKYTTPITEPVFELTDGRKVISPKVILYNQPGRNILSALNRIYADEANYDSDKKELIFIEELSAITKDYENLSICHDIPIEGTNIDYGIYDKKTKTLVLFEMKWFVEPVTSIEIKSKDEEISKGLHIQLPKYKNAIENSNKEFILRAFKEDLEVNECYYFVLTRITIGSGLIEPSEFKVINMRMVKKALFDTVGNLKVAAQRLDNKYYYPKIEKDFLLEQNHGKMGGITVVADSIKKLNGSFSLSIPTDENVNLYGIEMNPENAPENKFRKVGPSQYQLDNRLRSATRVMPNREERRKQEKQRRRKK